MWFGSTLIFTIWDVQSPFVRNICRTIWPTTHVEICAPKVLVAIIADCVASEAPCQSELMTPIHALEPGNGLSEAAKATLSS